MSLHQWVKLLCVISRCNRPFDSSGCQLVVFWFYSCLKEMLLGRSPFWCYAASFSLFVKKFLFQMYKILGKFIAHDFPWCHCYIKDFSTCCCRSFVQLTSVKVFEFGDLFSVLEIESVIAELVKLFHCLHHAFLCRGSYKQVWYWVGVLLEELPCYNTEIKR